MASRAAMAAAVISRAMQGWKARLEPGAYVPLQVDPMPMAWGPDTVTPVDTQGSQRYTRQIETYRRNWHPMNGFSNRPFQNLAPLVDIYSVYGNWATRLPSGPYAGGPNGAIVAGGMSWGPQSVNNMMPQTGVA